MEELREALRRYLAPRRQTALLAAIVALFMMRPLIGNNGVASASSSIALLALLLLALYAIQARASSERGFQGCCNAGMVLIATMSALVLGLLIASAKSSYDAQSGEVPQMSANIIQLDRMLPATDR